MHPSSEAPNVKSLSEAIAIDDFIAGLNLSVRASNVLRRMEIRSYPELLTINEDLLNRQRNCGRKTIAEIMDLLTPLKSHYPEQPKPKPHFSSDIQSLGLSVSATDALRRLGVNTTSELATTADEELLGMKSGLTNLAEIRERLWDFFVTTEEAQTLLDDKNPVEYLRLSVRATHGAHALKITNVGDLAAVRNHQLLELANMGKKSVREIHTKLLRYFVERDSLGAKQRDQLPDSPKLFVEKLLAELPQNLREILGRRFGLWNRKPEILQDIGDSRGCTRERIRQLESKALASLNWPGNQKIVRRFLDRLYKKHFSTVLQKDYGIATEDELRSVFLSLFGHLQEGMSVEKLLSKAFWNGDSLYEQCCLKAQNGVFTANEKLRREYLDTMTLVEKHLAHAKKPVPISDLLLIIRSEGPQISNGTVQRILQVAPSLQTDDKGLCGLSEWQYMRPKTLGDMIVRALVDIGKPAHFTQITMRINEKFSPQAPLNLRNVHARLLYGQETFVWQSSGVYGLTAWGLKKAPFVKDRLLQILKSARQPMALNQIVKKVLETCHCNEHTPAAILEAHDDLFVRLDKGIYGLREWTAA
jgi:DNA-directed RNA polymerase alpha subunit